MSKKITTLEMEIALADFFNARQNTIIPNVSWGLKMHEADLLIISKSGYSTEVEIKISKADLIKDGLKDHGHNCDKVKYLYFAIPEYLKDCENLIPEKAGILLAHHNRPSSGIYISAFGPHIEWSIRIHRPAPVLGNVKMTHETILHAARLGTMRIWRLKEKILKLKCKLRLYKKTVNN